MEDSLHGTDLCLLSDGNWWECSLGTYAGRHPCRQGVLSLWQRRRVQDSGQCAVSGAFHTRPRLPVQLAFLQAIRTYGNVFRISGGKHRSQPCLVACQGEVGAGLPEWPFGDLQAYIFVAGLQHRRTDDQPHGGAGQVLALSQDEVFRGDAALQPRGRQPAGGVPASGGGCVQSRAGRSPGGLCQDGRPARGGYGRYHRSVATTAGGGRGCD